MSRSFVRRQFIQGFAATVAGAVMVSSPNPVQAIEPIKRGHPQKMKLSFAAYSYRKYLQGDKKKNVAPTMTFMDFLDACAALGLKACEPTSYYFPPNVTEDYLLKFKHKAFMLGLDISGTAVGNKFTLPPGADRDEQLASIKNWIDNAVIFGAPCIRIFAGNVPKNKTQSQAIDWAIETTQLACDYAATKGVFLALENHGGIVAETDGLLAIVKGVESPWFGINLDSGNFHTEDPYGDLAKIAPYAVNAQVKVEIRPKGRPAHEADFDRIIGILADAGYRGYVALEYEGKNEPKEDVPRYLEKIQNAIDRV